MLHKTIPYNDLDGNPVSEDYWFQITQAEFAKKALTHGGEAYLEKLRDLAAATQNDMTGRGKEIMDTFETLLVDSVGKREGNLLIKNDEIKHQFMYSGAYDAFFMELITSEDSGASTLRSIFPANAQDAIEKALAEAKESPSGSDSTMTATAAGTVVGSGSGGGASAEPTPFPQSLEKAKAAVEAPQPTQTVELQAAAPKLSEAGKDEEPGWLKEGRYPTQGELIRMPQDELKLAMKMKSAKAFG